MRFILDRFCNEQVKFAELEIGETGQEADKCYLEAQSGLDRKVLEKVVLVGKQRVTQNLYLFYFSVIQLLITKTERSI